MLNLRVGTNKSSVSTLLFIVDPVAPLNIRRSWIPVRRSSRQRYGVVTAFYDNEDVATVHTGVASTKYDEYCIKFLPSCQKHRHRDITDFSTLKRLWCELIMSTQDDTPSVFVSFRFRSKSANCG